MSKVICDICGTTYQDTADCCPICGCSRDIASELAKEDFLVDGNADRSVSKRREIFDFDEVNTPKSAPEDVDEDYAYDGEEDESEEEPPQHNTLLVVLLTVLIVALLSVTAFLCLKFLLPGLNAEETTPPTTVYQLPQVTEPIQTTDPRIPCQSLALSTGNAELTEEGGMFLLNVIKTPEDTTDDLAYLSEDPSIATVSEDGRITAVSEGETVITIVCGDQVITCPVICKFQVETEPVETTPATEETVAATVDPNVKLKLKKSDIRLGVYYQFQLELDCNLEPTQVEWSSEHPYIATVDENGVVTAIKSGTTEITAKYGDQEAKCIIRCF